MTDPVKIKLADKHIMIIINVTFLPDNCFNIRVSRPVDQSCCEVVLLQTAEHRKKVREEKNQTNNDLSQPYSPIFSTILRLPQVKYNSSTEAWWAAEMLHFRSGSGSWRLRAFPMLLLSEQSRKHNGGLAYTWYTVDAYRVCMCMWVTALLLLGTGIHENLPIPIPQSISITYRYDFLLILISTVMELEKNSRKIIK